MERQPNTQYILHLSYGKDSLACPEALLRLGYPLDRIVHAEVWATDTIPADLPPMVEFKAHADKIIKERYGIEVEHICAMKNGKKLTYEDIFYRPMKRKVERERERGFTAFPFSEETGVRATSNNRLCDTVESVLHRGTQETSSYGFPISVNRGNWCTGLKCFRTSTYHGVLT